jgi:hypothetical protein
VRNTRTRGHNHTGRFVPEDVGIDDGVLSNAPVQIVVQVTAANSDGPYPDQYFSRTGLRWLRHLTFFELALSNELNRSH